MKFSFDEGGDNADLRELIYGPEPTTNRDAEPSEFVKQLEKFASDFRTEIAKLAKKRAAGYAKADADFESDFAKLKTKFADSLILTIKKD